LWSYQRQENYFDFWKISQSQLLHVGIKPEHIEIAGLCTACHPELFYSYRAEQITGRFATVIGILE
jgi:copper oxidase (laccase) domain-containing protein